MIIQWIIWHRVCGYWFVDWKVCDGVPILLRLLLQTQSKLFSNLIPFLVSYFPPSSNFPLECSEREKPLTGQVIAISLSLGLSVSASRFFLCLCTGLWSALLTNKTLRRRVEFTPQRLWCIGFCTVRAALSLTVSLLSWEPFFCVYNFQSSLFLPSSCLSGYHLQFNAYLGWALTIASTMKWPRPCLHA